MVTIVTRAAKGEALTHDEVDANFNNLNSGKAEVSALTAHTGNTANPHAVTKAQVGLSNVDNTSDVSKPVSTLQQAALDLKANLAGSTFTGPVLVPDKVAGTNDGSAANTKFVQTAIASLVNTAPAALDTLNELAAALGNDPNFATTMTNSLSLKANAANAALTGTTSVANVSFSGTGGRIIGDFSNGTLASRVLFQTSTTNGLTGLGILPNGTSTTALINLIASSDTANGSIFQLKTDGTNAIISSFANGTGAGLPLSIQVASAEAMRIDTSRNVMIGTTSAQGTLTVDTSKGAGGLVIGDIGTQTNNTQMYWRTTGLARSTIVTGGKFVWDNTAGTEFMRMDAGSLSIGTTSVETGTLLWTHKNSAYWNYLKASNTLNSMYVGVTDVGTTRLASLGNYQIELAINGATKATLDASGNLGIGVAPSAWTTNRRAIEFSTVTGATIMDVASLFLTRNAYDNGANWVRKTAAPASFFGLNTNGNNEFQWLLAPTGTAGSAITWTTAMTLDNSGNLLVGVTSGSNHIIAKNVAEGNGVLYVHNGTGAFITFMNGTAGGANGAGSVAYLNKNSTTSRSINAAGTINASGADYAEYMRKAADCGVIAKGAIVGVNVDGELTDKWTDAVSFVVKSTDPSYVGGDTWGSEEALGLVRPTDSEAEDYADRLAEFEAALEEARSRVDRIAFAGQVPVNVLGANVGDYIVPVQDGDGIKGIAVAEDDMNLKQYIKAVGIVQNILTDGRANIRVKVA